MRWRRSYNEIHTTQSQRRQTMHVCPLQLDIVDRLINPYSNEGDLVLDPFGGLGTVGNIKGRVFRPLMNLPGRQSRPDEEDIPSSSMTDTSGMLSDIWKRRKMKCTPRHFSIYWRIK